MKITDDSPPVLSALDRPNSYIGRSVPRPNLQRLTQGRGQYVSDVTLPRMAHVAFVRSPHAHARIVNIAADAAKKSRALMVRLPFGPVASTSPSSASRQAGNSAAGSAKAMEPPSVPRLRMAVCPICGMARAISGAYLAINSERSAWA